MRKFLEGQNFGKMYNSRRARIESVITDTILNNRLKSTLFRETKNFFVRAALVCMAQHAKAIGEFLASLDYYKNAS